LRTRDGRARFRLARDKPAGLLLRPPDPRRGQQRDGGDCQRQSKARDETPRGVKFDVDH
jgi:hypothetical protein